MGCFGPLIDSYTISQSVADGATVPIYYEARLPKHAIEGPKTLDWLFEDIFSDEADENREWIRHRYANKKAVAEAERRSERRKKTVQITVDGAGVRIAAPMATPGKELRAIVRKRAPWTISHASDIVGGRAEALRQRRDAAVPGPQRPHGRGARPRTIPGGPLRPLAPSGRRGDPSGRRGTLRTNPARRHRVVSCPGHRTISGGRRALVAPPRSGSEAVRPHPG